MNLIGKYKLRKDALKHGNTKGVIEAWIRVVEDARWNNITEVKLT